MPVSTAHGAACKIYPACVAKISRSHAGRHLERKKGTLAFTFGIKQRFNIMEESSFEKLKKIRKERHPCCTLCRNHGIRTNSKGHKHHCPFLKCDCEPCIKKKKKRVVMSKQVRLRRKQMKVIEGRSNYVTPVEPGRGKQSQMLAKDCCSFPKVNLILLFHLKFSSF